MKRILVLLIILSISMNSFSQQKTKVKTGLDVLIEQNAESLKGKNVGIITNQTGIDSRGRHIMDVLAQFPDISIAAVYGPEHGIRGDKPDAEKVASYIDERTGIRVWSLYGNSLKPTEKMMNGIDLLVYDIQDVGARFYTFISTMGLAMEAAAEHGIPFMVLDRPNPITGKIVEGPVLQMKHASFVGKFPIPIRYAMTPGEVALMIKGEGWMNAMEKLDLTVVPLEGWSRDMWFDETGLPWLKPSPNIPSLQTAILYPGMCLFEATNLAEARGTMRPFEIFGAPWVDKEKLADLMNEHALPGIYFRPISFMPVSIPDVAVRAKFLNERIHGLEMIITDRERLRPVDVMVFLLNTLRVYYPDEFKFRTNLERLIGITGFRTQVMNARQPEAILKDWHDGINEFLEIRKNYLTY